MSELKKPSAAEPDGVTERVSAISARQKALLKDATTIVTGDRKKKDWGSVVDGWLEKAWSCQRLNEESIKKLCSKAKEILLKEPTVINVPAPVTIAGDIHGQFYDLVKLFETGGSPPDTNYLFLGDYVDRGHHGVECMTLLLLLKLKYPDKVTLLRGNHEARAQTQVFGFYDECIFKYGNPGVWRAFTSLFDCLPVAAVVDGKLFCIHGGLSPSVQTIDSLRQEERVMELPSEGPLADLTWSDPEDSHLGWMENERGAGYTFGEDVVEEWNERNGTEGVVRGHQMFMEGYCYHHNKKTLTVFSAPNYVYRAGNLAAILKVEDLNSQMFIDQFEHAKDKPVVAQPELRVPRFFL